MKIHFNKRSHFIFSRQQDTRDEKDLQTSMNFNFSFDSIIFALVLCMAHGKSLSTPDTRWPQLCKSVRMFIFTSREKKTKKYEK